MTIKGTLETFNLRELLQMLAFNRKVGTLVLETERGTQTVHVDKGLVAFVDGDPGASLALERVLRRRALVRDDRLQRAIQIQEASGAYLGQVLRDLGALEEAVLHETSNQAVAERFLTLQLTAITRFEFADGRVLAPDGTDHWPDGRPRAPIEPGLVVEGLLLDLTRKMDQWVELQQIVPTMEEVYEGTGLSVDLEEALAQEEVEPEAADLVIAGIDGYRTLDQVVGSSHVDELTAVQLAAALVQGGGIRPVATQDLMTRGEDLLTRGEPGRALPLLRRAIERGDAAPEARLHLADALELTSHRLEAAVQLETFAELADEEDPNTVHPRFDAMNRALELRDGDLATATRVCDFYLQHRPWLHDRKAPALESLKQLIQGATTVNQPLIAAERLHQYIHNGDAPNEDLLVLADLYADGGDRMEAAAALCRRAENLLHQGRAPQARELLRRALHLDPSRQDARGRLQLLDGEERREKHRHRMAISLVVTALLVLGVGAAWWTYNQEAGRAIRRVRARAERTVTAAEREIDLRVDDFAQRFAAAHKREKPDTGLGATAQSLLEESDRLATQAGTALLELAKEIDRYEATAHGERNGAVLRQLESRLEGAKERARTVIQSARDEAARELDTGKKAYAEGHFMAARPHLVLAQSIAFDQEGQGEHAGVLLTHVDNYIARFEENRKELDHLRESGDVRAAFLKAVDILASQLDSDLTRQIRVPISVASEPDGARIRLDGQPLDCTTPCTLEYSPFEGTELTLELPGHVPQRFQLPSFTKISEKPDDVRAYVPEISAKLPEGPKWVLESPRGPVKALWASRDVPLLLDSDGRSLTPVRADVGALGPHKAFRRHEPVQAGGSLGGEVEWRLLGQRTLAIRPPLSEPWEVQILGQLKRPPVLHDGIVTVIDERGDIYGFQLLTGERVWHRSLDAPPAQDPVRATYGVLMTTRDGGAWLVKANSGAVRPLSSPGQGLVLALPLGEDTVLLGGKAHEARVVTRNGQLERLGLAAPTSSRAAAGPAGVAWIESDGVHFLAPGGNPIRVAGLGDHVAHLALDGKELYAAGADGVLRAARVDQPDATQWQCPVPGTVTQAPLPLGDAVYVLADGKLYAIER